MILCERYRGQSSLSPIVSSEFAADGSEHSLHVLPASYLSTLIWKTEP
jgi:hypothetical protein